MLRTEEHLCWRDSQGSDLNSEAFASRLFNLRVLEQKVNASDPPSPRLRRAKQTERCGQVRPATIYHALLRIADHVQHLVQKQGRPVPKRSVGQGKGLRNTRFLPWGSWVAVPANLTASRLLCARRNTHCPSGCVVQAMNVRP